MNKVSIIIPCYNQEKFIEEAVMSALQQTYPDVEIICINDGSTDKSSLVIQQLVQKHEQIIFIDQKENRGVVEARNKAINAATGEYILPLDADDTIEPTYIEEAIKILDNNTDIGVVYSKARMFGAKRGKWKLPDFSISNILYANCVFVSAVFRKKDFINIGGYKEYMQDGYEDWDLWLSFIEKGFKIHRIDKYLFNYRKHHKPTRTKLVRTKMNNIYKQVLCHHLPLFFEEKNFIDKIFKSTTSKVAKYKKLFYITLWIVLLEFIIIIGISSKLI